MFVRRRLPTCDGEIEQPDGAEGFAFVDAGVVRVKLVNGENGRLPVVSVLLEDESRTKLAEDNAGACGEQVRPFPPGHVDEVADEPDRFAFGTMQDLQTIVVLVRTRDHSDGRRGE